MSSESPPPFTAERSSEYTTQSNQFSLHNLKHYLTVISERWLLGLSCALLVTVLAGYYLLSRPAEYRATSTLLVEPYSDQILDMDKVVDFGSERRSGGDLVSTHLAQLTNRTFLQRVADSFSTAEQNWILRPYRDGKAAADDAGPSVLGVFASNISVQRVPNTFLLNISVTQRDPQTAALIANRIAEQYIYHLLDRSEEGNVSALSFLREQAANLRKESEALERKLQQYRSRHNLVSLEENQNIIVANMKELNAAVTQARIERLGVDGLLEQVQSYGENDRNLLEVEVIASYGSLPRLKQELERLEGEREVMSERYMSRHPSMIENQRSLDTVRQQMERNIQQAIADLRSRAEHARARESRLRDELALAERKSLELDELRVEYGVMQRELETTRQTYGQILARLDETVITSQLENTNLKIVDAARAPSSPASPNVRRTTLVLAFVGIGIFIAIPIGLDAMNNRLRSWSDVETYLGRRLLGEIAQVRGVDPKIRGQIVLQDLDDAIIESFRAIYSQVSLNSTVEEPKVQLVASTIPSEGKTFCTTNLAAVQAANGKRTLIIDCDLRRPSVHRQFGIEREPGLLAWFENGASTEGDLLENKDLRIQEVAENLFVLPAGGRSKKPGILYEGSGLERLLEWAKKSFDVIMIDTPPLGIFPDVFSISRLVDETIYVSRFNQVSRQQIRSILDRLDVAESELMGVVINEMPRRRSGSYHYSGYGYYDNKAYQKYYKEDR